MAEKQNMQQPMFTAKALWALVVPLILEQILAVTVGMADTAMVSGVGEAAISGISIVDQLNALLIQVFAALSTGGAVVASQYIGRRDPENACRSAKQLLYLVSGVSAVITVLVLLLDEEILRAIYGRVDRDVMDAALIYFRLSALSYPFIALYNTGAALFRSMGNSRVSLETSAVMNVMNIAGNALLIYGCNLGVAGAGIATLVSRMTAGMIVTGMLFNKKHLIHLENIRKPEWSGTVFRGILRIGVPNGLEGGVFQIGKLMVAGLITTFGTSAIAANAVSGAVTNICNVPGAALGLSMLTVVGQCVGAKDYAQARHYIRQMMKTAYLGVGVMTVILFLCAPAVVGLFSLEAEAQSLAILIVRLNCAALLLFSLPAFALPFALRAAGDAKFTMIVSMVSMWVFRIGLAYVFSIWMHLGLVGVWLAMHADWIVRMIAFVTRFHGHKWEQAHVID